MGPKYESRQSSGSDSSMTMSREEVFSDEYPAEADESNSDSEVSIPCSKQREYVGVNFDFKVTMNKLWGRLFIIIFIDVYRQSKYIPTVTNFASILANCFYFLRKVTPLRPSILNF